MNKPKLAKALSEKTKAPVAITAEFIDALFDTISEHLQQGQKVTLGNFGTLYLTQHKERRTAHPKTGKELVLPVLTLAKFRPSGSLKDQVNKKHS